MKILIPAIFLLMLVCVGILFVNQYEQSNYRKFLQSEVDHLREQNKFERDSLEKELSATRDSLSIALYTIKVRHEETTKAKAATMREINKLKSIVFVQHPNDSLRIKEIKKLYPSWKEK